MSNSLDTAQRPAQPVVDTGPWFAIRSGWLFAGVERVNLAGVTRYNGCGNSVTLYHGQWSVSVTDSRTEREWDAPSRELLAALDSFFANAADVVTAPQTPQHEGR